MIQALGFPLDAIICNAENGPKRGIEFDNLSGARGYDAWKMYGQSNSQRAVLHATSRPRRFDPRLPLVLKSPGQGAATQVYCAVHPDAADRSGEYGSNVNIAKSSRNRPNLALADKLLEETERILETL